MALAAMMLLQCSVVDGRRSLAVNDVVTEEFRRCGTWMTLTEFSNSTTTRLVTGRHHRTSAAAMSGPHVQLSLCAARSRRRRSRLGYRSHTSYILVSFTRLDVSATAALSHLVGFHGMNSVIYVLIDETHSLLYSTTACSCVSEILVLDELLQCVRL